LIFSKFQENPNNKIQNIFLGFGDWDFLWIWELGFLIDSKQ
jgi:hypothetical protein